MIKHLIVIALVALALSLPGCADYAYQRGCNGPLPLAFNCQ